MFSLDIINLLLVNFLISKYNYVSGSIDWIVTTRYGDVRGYWSEQQKVWRFVGIPYATPPLGKLRYKPPLPASPWTGIINATNDYTVCPQVTSADVDISEDCLLINVFVPESVRTDQQVPVMFFAHGGTFISGNGINVYNPHLTTRFDIILVTFNYRLGPLGYNCLGTDRIPGNAALKDYIAALRWVNSNIAGFGGDPNAVTLYGSSAGAIQVHALLLSDKAKGLFHQAVIESGSAFSYISFNYNRIAIPKALALDLGHKHVDEFDELQDFLETVPAMDLVNSFSKSTMNSNTYRRNDNNLCIERKLTGTEAVITEIFQYKAVSRNYDKVPIIVAFNELEGMRFSVDFYNIIDELNNNFHKLLPHDIHFIPKSEREKVTNAIRTFYFGNKTITKDDAYNYILYRTDIQFFYGIYQIAMQYSYFCDNPVYLLKFSYHGGFSRPSDFPEFNAAGHEDLLGYIMDIGYYNNVTEKDEEIRDKLTKLWTNFVKFGDPTPDDELLSMRWARFTPDEQHYLQVDQEMTIQQFPHPDRVQLWAKIYDKYYYPPPTFEDNIH